MSNECVAVKVIPKQEQNSFQKLMTSTQVGIIKKAIHPNIIPLIDAFESHGKYYIITPFAKKGDLWHLVNQKGNLSEWSAAYLVKQILSALHYLHRTQHTIHGDIKLENVVLTEDFTAKLVDFGFAFEFSEDSPVVRMDKTIGTIAYLAPECWDGLYSTASDIWATGVLLCYLLFMQPPLLKPLDKPVQNKRESIHLKELYQARHLSKECKEFIESLLRKNPRERLTAEAALEHPWIRTYSVVGMVE